MKKVSANALPPRYKKGFFVLFFVCLFGPPLLLSIKFGVSALGNGLFAAAETAVAMFVLALASWWMFLACLFAIFWILIGFPYLVVKKLKHIAHTNNNNNNKDRR